MSSRPVSCDDDDDDDERSFSMMASAFACASFITSSYCLEMIEMVSGGDFFFFIY